MAEEVKKRGPGRPRKYPRPEEVDAKLKEEIPVLVVTMGRSHRVEIGPRVTDPGYPTYLYFSYWDIKRAGLGAGEDTPMCCIKLTKDWYENYIEGKAIYEWLNTYDKLLNYFDKQEMYEFGCPICGETLVHISEYLKHIQTHKEALANL